MRLADKFTLVRIIYAPVFCGVYYLAASIESLALPLLAALTAVLIFAEITDYLDGSTARRLNQVSATGKILDPFADALLHLTIFFSFTLTGEMPALLFILIFYREFSMLFLRLYATQQGLDIAARLGGKFKTVLYIVTCFWTLAGKLYFLLPISGLPFKGQIPLIGIALFSLCAAASYLSFGEYLYRWVLLRKSSKG